jgi:hypothetical protein
MSEKSSFYMSVNEKKAETPFQPQSHDTHIGSERRKNNRRTQIDRRGDIRFELDKDDRRKEEGRRETDAQPKYY